MRARPRIVAGPRVALSLAGAGLLAGCSLLGPAPLHADSPFPGHLAAEGAAFCGTGPSSDGRLPPGERCLALVRAERWHSDTGLAVRAGEHYRIDVPPGQFWFDAGRRSVPPRGEDGSPVMNLFASWKRQPGSRWFALIAATVVPGADGPAEDDPHDTSCRPGQPLEVRRDGRLVLYPNDASFPWGRRELFYGNNTGQVWVLLQACGTGASCAGDAPRQEAAAGPGCDR